MDHGAWMSEALAEARRAAEMGEVPVGAVIAIPPASGPSVIAATAKG
mgnify:CR=1 FL=1